MLLSLQGKPLQACYCGPYTVEQKINRADYLVKTPGRRKEKRMCHINMLKPYHVRGGNETPVAVAMNCAAESENEPDVMTRECEEIGRSPGLKNSEVLLNVEQKLNHLPVQEREMLKELLGEFAILFPDVPGKTRSP